MVMRDPVTVGAMVVDEIDHKNQGASHLARP
jgi:hypothetical protein